MFTFCPFLPSFGSCVTVTRKYFGSGRFSPVLASVPTACRSCSASCTLTFPCESISSTCRVSTVVIVVSLLVFELFERLRDGDLPSRQAAEDVTAHRRPQFAV